MTFLAPSGRDGYVAALAQAFEAASRLPLGAGDKPAMRASPSPLGPIPAQTSSLIEVALFGAHMRGLPLNRDIIALGGKFVRIVKTAPHYRCFLLPGAIPRPGILRVDKAGAAIKRKSGRCRRRDLAAWLRAFHRRSASARSGWPMKRR